MDDCWSITDSLQTQLNASLPSAPLCHPALQSASCHLLPAMQHGSSSSLSLLPSLTLAPFDFCNLCRSIFDPNNSVTLVLWRGSCTTTGDPVTHFDHHLWGIHSAGLDLTGFTAPWNLILFLCLLIYLLTASWCGMAGPGFPESTFREQWGQSQPVLIKSMGSPVWGSSPSSTPLIPSPALSFYAGLSGCSPSCPTEPLLASSILIITVMLFEAGGCQNVSKVPELLNWVIVMGRSQWRWKWAFRLNVSEGTSSFLYRISKVPKTDRAPCFLAEFLEDSGQITWYLMDQESTRIYMKYSHVFFQYLYFGL